MSVGLALFRVGDLAGGLSRCRWLVLGRSVRDGHVAEDSGEVQRALGDGAHIVVARVLRFDTIHEQSTNTIRQRQRSRCLSSRKIAEITQCPLFFAPLALQSRPAADYAESS